MAARDARVARHGRIDQHAPTGRVYALADALAHVHASARRDEVALHGPLEVEVAAHRDEVAAHGVRLAHRAARDEAIRGERGGLRRRHLGSR